MKSLKSRKDDKQKIKHCEESINPQTRFSLIPWCSLAGLGNRLFRNVLPRSLSFLTASFASHFACWTFLGLHKKRGASITNLDGVWLGVRKVPSQGGACPLKSPWCFDRASWWQSLFNLQLVSADEPCLTWRRSLKQNNLFTRQPAKPPNIFGGKIKMPHSYHLIKAERLLLFQVL